jgi:large subunit ribosomal protein L4
MKLAVANISSAHLLPYVGANVYDILNHEKLVLSVSAVNLLEKRFA